MRLLIGFFAALWLLGQLQAQPSWTVEPSSYFGALTGRLSLDDVADAAASTGLRGDALAHAIAIAGWDGSPDAGESWGGRVCALGDENIAGNGWGPSVGIWQIRSRAGQQGTGGVRDGDRLCDVGFNARSMFEISSGGTDWTPWAKFTNGGFRANLAEARVAAAKYE